MSSGALTKYLRKARSARIVAECGAGKTFMALGTAHAHSSGRPYSAIAMCPPHIVQKWAREALVTIPNARAFLIEDMRNGGDPKQPHGLVEVKLREGRTVVNGLKTTLPELRKLGRNGWRALCPQPAFFILGKEKGKLGYFILVFASWYWRLDAGVPNAHHLRKSHTDGAFLFPQMMLDSETRKEMGEQEWRPGFVDYLFVAFNTSTAFSPTDCPVLSRWAKGAHDGPVLDFLHHCGAPRCKSGEHPVGRPSEVSEAPWLRIELTGILMPSAQIFVGNDTQVVRQV